MPIEREPHRVFAAFWGTWWLFTLYVFLFGGVTAWVIWLASFIAVEVPASLIDTGKRDTLSEVMTWVQRKLSKHKTFARGWNALILFLVDLVTSVGFLPLWEEFRHIMFLAQLPIMAILIGVWLYDHWMSPDVNG